MSDEPIKIRQRPLDGSMTDQATRTDDIEYLPRFRFGRDDGETDFTACSMCVAIVYLPDQAAHTAWHQRLVLERPFLPKALPKAKDVGR